MPGETVGLHLVLSVTRHVCVELDILLFKVILLESCVEDHWCSDDIDFAAQQSVKTDSNWG